jgi:hypothetical protein
MTDFLQTLDERSDGIGAADAAPAVAFGLSAGYAHTAIRYWANWQRKRAFDRIPAYAVLEPAGNHTFGATEAELRLGCPAWPKDQCCDAHPDGWGRCEPSR